MHPLSRRDDGGWQGSASLRPRDAAQALDDVNGARLAAFTIGGLITMLSLSMIPFAFAKGGVLAGMWAVVGFGITLAAS